MPAQCYLKPLHLKTLFNISVQIAVFMHFILVACPTLKTPDSGFIFQTTDGRNTIANYSCADGYEFKGVNIRTCLEDGLWTDNDPVCGKFQICLLICPKG